MLLLCFNICLLFPCVNYHEFIEPWIAWDVLSTSTFVTGNLCNKCPKQLLEQKSCSSDYFNAISGLYWTAEPQEALWQYRVKFFWIEVYVRISNGAFTWRYAYLVRPKSSLILWFHGTFSLNKGLSILPYLGGGWEVGMIFFQKSFFSHFLISHMTWFCK